MSQVLVAHALSYRMRRTTLEFVDAFGRYAPEGTNVLYHNVRRPLRPDIRHARLDALLLPYDVLSLRSAAQWPWVMERLLPLAAASDRIIALPQDDYTYNRILDDSLRELGVHVIYTPLESGRELVYPTMSRVAEMRLALTGYVDPSTAAIRRLTRTPLAARPIDVGQRVRLLPPWFGRRGREKGLLAERFAERARSSGLVVNISTRDGDSFSGESWYEFLGSCRATLGQKGGASLCDPEGSIMKRVVDFQALNPDAAFEEIEAACFPGLDMQAVMSAVSPRLFDAAMLGTVQILVEDDYLGVLEPWVHYIPTDQELSNFTEIEAALRDVPLLEKIAAAAEEALIHSGDFTYDRFVKDVFSTEIGHSAHAPVEPASTDVAAELQWRLTPMLFEAVQRLIYVATSASALPALIALAEDTQSVLTQHPWMITYLDQPVLRLLTGSSPAPPALRPIEEAALDVFVECARAGALGAAIKWLRGAGLGAVSEWENFDWIDKERLDLERIAAG